MSATKIFAATTGLRPFSINRISITLAFTIATLVIAKLVNAFLFCGFNANTYMDLPFGIALFTGYCIMPLLGLAVNWRPKTNGGCCCRMFTMLFISGWHQCSTWMFACIVVEAYFQISSFGRNDGYLFDAAWDPLSVCGNRTLANVRAQFRNAMPTYVVLQRIDLVYKMLVALGWVFAAVFAGAAGTFLSELMDGENVVDSEAGSQVDNDEAIIWMEGEEEPKEFSAATELETIDEVRGQPATDDIDRESALADAIRKADQPSMGSGIDEEAAEIVKSSDRGDNDAETTFADAQPEIKCVDEKED